MSANCIDHTEVLRTFLLGLGDARLLLEPEQLTTRLAVLDQLDAILGDIDMAAGVSCSNYTIIAGEIIASANVLRSQFEAANEQLFAAARSELAFEGKCHTIHRWLTRSVECQDPRPGLGFDVLDEIVSGVLRLSDPGAVSPLDSPEMVPYQPTPARHVLDLIRTLDLSSHDTLVDLGSGLGHVPLLVSMLTGSRAVGVEFQPAYVLCAQECAQTLKLSRAEFIAGDARDADLSAGTVFYFFSPFKGSVLDDMLESLLRESGKRWIRICSLGPCTRILQKQQWLRSRSQPASEQISVFESR